mgnify:CR=1 FL=1
MTEAILKMKKIIRAKRGGFSVAAARKMKIETLNIALIIGIAALAVTYLVSASSVATASYRESVLEKIIDGIKMEIMNINLELSEKRSIGFLKKAAAELNLVVSESIQYIKIVGPVAKQ